MKIEHETKEESIMSFDAIRWAIEKAPTKTVTEHAVLISLADRLNRTETECYPSIKTIQKDARIGSKTTVIKALNSLEEKGLIVRKEKGYAKGHSTRYQLKLDQSIIDTGPELDRSINNNNRSRIDTPTGPELNLTGPEVGNEPDITSKKEPIFNQKDEFDKFWAAYPRKIGKGQACKAWKKLPKSVTVDQLIAAIEAQLADRASAPRGSFIPEWKNPSTWLNGECWTDEPLFANQLALPASDPDDEIYGFDAYYPPPRIAWQNAQNDAGLTTYVEIDSPELQNRLKNVNTACSQHFSEPSRLRPLLFAKTAENGSESPQIVFPSKIVLEEFKRLVFDLREVEPENESIQAPFDAAVGKIK